MKKQCLICNKEYITYYKTQRFCSNECKYKSPIYKIIAQRLAENNKGKHCHTEEWKESLRKKYTGKNNPAKRPEVKEKIRQWNLGKKYSNKINKKKGMPKDKNPNWKNGATLKWMRFRSNLSSKLANWSKQIKKRDNYNCQKCNYKGKNVQSDHIKPVRDYPELALDLNNGQTLCIPCHKIKTIKMFKESKEGEICRRD